MSRAKYPRSERATASRLRGGDEILVRDRGADFLPLQEWTFESRAHLPTGIFEVVSVTPFWKTSGRRDVRYYRVHVVNGAGDFTVEVSAVQRFNVVVREGA